MSRKPKKDKKRLHLTPDQIKERELMKRRFDQFTADEDFDGFGAPAFSFDAPEEKAKPVRGSASPLSPSVGSRSENTTRPRRLKARLPETDALLLTVPDLCALLSISRMTLHRMEQAGEIPGRLKLGGVVRYHRETVEAWLRGLLNDK